MSLSAHWNAEAERWSAWARAPGHDSYWYESGPPFFELLPPPRGRTLDLGCGEGRVARDLRTRGYAATGIDVAPTMIRLAREADPDGDYLVADAAVLPFADATFDLAVAFNSLMDIDDMPGAVCETSRVLRPNSRFCICITHPTRDAGRYETPERFVIDGTRYLQRRALELRVARGGLEMTFKSWTYPLESYVRALEEADFLIESLREPPDPARPFPNFLLIRALKRTSERPH